MGAYLAIADARELVGDAFTINVTPPIILETGLLIHDPGAIAFFGICPEETTAVIVSG
mgnify:CR=1 FL=1